MVASTWWNPTALSAYVTIALLVVGIVSLILGYRSLIGLGRQVENVKEQLDVARENLRVDSQALLGTFRPVLIEAKLQGDSTSMGDRGILLRSADTQAELTLPIKNAGAGPAFIRECLLSPRPGVAVRANGWRTVFPANETEVLSFTLKSGSVEHSIVMAAESYGGLDVKIRYVDITGETHFVTSLSLTELSRPYWVASTTEIFESEAHWEPKKAVYPQGSFPEDSSPIRYI